ncbi:MAG TPA: polyprenyl synthetase family protein [Acidimicrobiales bacterium]
MTNEAVGVPDIAALVEARVNDFLDGEEARWAAVDTDLVEPLRHLRALVRSGGKRLRPLFCYWAYVGAGGTDLEAVVDAGAACELLHAFALLHDDVMDGSELRRGQPTAHRVYRERHADAGWRGEARRFGEGVAVLIGDLAFVYADRLVADVNPDARQVWNDLRTEINIGQYLDILGTARNGADLDTARLIATYKSGKYTIERPLHLGAALAGRLDDLGGPLSGYGLPLGEAFQLRDDLLGVFGDSSVTGKPVGDDLREGKPTVLVALARERADRAQADALRRVGRPDLDADDVATLQAVLRATGAPEEVENRIGELESAALAALRTADLTVDATDALEALAAQVAWRDR